MLEMSDRIYIFGAHSRGRTFKAYINFLYPETVVEAFIVDAIYENGQYIDGIAVKEIGKWMDTEVPVYIATRGIYHEKIIENLCTFGIKAIIPVTVNLDMQLRNEYMRKFYEYNEKKFIKLKNLPLVSEQCKKKKAACVYVATSIHDSMLQEKYSLKSYEKRIQVGSALTEERLENAEFDCIGDNISEKNRQYCELTGLYWIWKHAKEDYVGLCHYRRHFILPDDWVGRMEQNSIDVILPVPLYVAPNLEDNFRGRHAAREWDCMMKYLQDNLPEDYESAKMFFKGNLYSPCNMLIAKKQVLDELCIWLFPILDTVVAECGVEQDKYENRYPGFLSERLITYFFESKQQYKVAYADKNFLK